MQKNEAEEVRRRADRRVRCRDRREETHTEEAQGDRGRGLRSCFDGVETEGGDRVLGARLLRKRTALRLSGDWALGA